MLLGRFLVTLIELVAKRSLEESRFQIFDMLFNLGDCATTNC